MAVHANQEGCINACHSFLSKETLSITHDRLHLGGWAILSSLVWAIATACTSSSPSLVWAIATACNQQLLLFGVGYSHSLYQQLLLFGGTVAFVAMVYDLLFYQV